MPGLLDNIGGFLSGNSSFGVLGPLAAGTLGGLALGGSSGSDLVSYMFGGGTARSAVTPQPPAYLTSALSGLMPQAAAGIQPPQFTGTDFVAPIDPMQTQGINALGGLGLSGLAPQTVNAGNAANAIATGTAPMAPGYSQAINSATGIAQGDTGANRFVERLNNLSAGRGETLGTLVPGNNAIAAQARGGGVTTAGADVGQSGLTRTAAGDYLYGGDAFNAAVDAAMRRVMPAVGSAFGGSGRLRSGLADVALGQGVTDAFASQYAQERANQQAAQGALLNQQNIARQQQLNAANAGVTNALQARGLQANAAQAGGALANQSAGLSLSASGQLLDNNLGLRGQQLQAAGMAPAFEALRGLPAERLLQAGQTAQNLNTAQAQGARDAALTNNQLQQGDLAARTANVATLAGATPIGNEQTTELPANPLAGLLGLAALAGGGSGGGAGGVGSGLGGLGSLGGALGSAGEFLGNLFGGGSGSFPGVGEFTFDPTGLINGTEVANWLGSLGGIGEFFNSGIFGDGGLSQLPLDSAGNIIGTAINNGGGGLGLPPTPPLAPFLNGAGSGAGAGAGSAAAPPTNGPTMLETEITNPGIPQAPSINPPASLPNMTQVPGANLAPEFLSGLSNPLASIPSNLALGSTAVVANSLGTIPGTGAALVNGGFAATNPLAGLSLDAAGNVAGAGISNAATGAAGAAGEAGAATGAAASEAGSGLFGGLGASGALAAAAPALAYLAMTAGSRAERNEANSIADSWAADITEAQNAGRETVNVELGGNTYTLRVGNIGDVKTGRWFQLANGQWLGIGAEGRPTPIISNAPPDVSSTASAPSYVQNGQLVTGPALTPWQLGLPGTVYGGGGGGDR